jgi:hypothetical protein
MPLKRQSATNTGAGIASGGRAQAALSGIHRRTPIIPHISVLSSYFFCLLTYRLAETPGAAQPSISGRIGAG